MNNQILDKLRVCRGKTAMIGIDGDTPIPIGIHLIDEVFETVTLINGKRRRALNALRDSGNVSQEEEKAILSNPDHFSVIPIHRITFVKPIGD